MKETDVEASDNRIMASAVVRDASESVSETGISGISTAPHKQAQLDRVYLKITRALIPLSLAITTLNFLDRTNVAYASLQMNAQLGFSPSVYGLGSSLFFAGFVLCQVPSNLILMRVGARKWLAVLLFGWGTVATCTMFVNSKASFFAVRVLLGVFEAGTFPGLWHYLSLFFSSERMTKPYAWLSMGILLSALLGAPLAAGLLSMDGLGGLHGWQWLFILEGIPTILIGFVVLLVLPDTAMQARWLSAEEKELLEEDINSKMSETLTPGVERAVLRLDSKAGASGEPSLKRTLQLFRIALSNPLLYYIVCVGFISAVAGYAMTFWLPIVINGLLENQVLDNLQVAAKGPGQTGAKAALVTTIPFACSAVFGWTLAHSSQRKKELYFHASIPFILAGIFLIVFAPMARISMLAGFISLVLVVTLGGGANGLNFAIAGKITAGPAQPVAMPLFNCVGATGGLVGPLVAGTIVQATGSFTYVAVIMGTCMSLVGVMMLLLRWIAGSWERRLAKSRSLELPSSALYKGASETSSGPSRGSERSFAPMLGGGRHRVEELLGQEEGQGSPRRRATASGAAAMQ